MHSGFIDLSNGLLGSIVQNPQHPYRIEHFNQWVIVLAHNIAEIIAILSNLSTIKCMPPYQVVPHAFLFNILCFIYDPYLMRTRL